MVQGSIEIVLKNPGPSNYEEIYPIQVSFYEDMHQNDFWNVGVRTFGHGFLHYRSLRGSFCRIDYVDRQGKVYKGGMERRLPPRYPYTNLSESFRTKVEELRSMAQLTPEQRSAVDFGQRIVISSNAEAEFWTDARFKHTRVTQLFEQIGLMQTSRGTPEVLEEIVRLLTTAITNHQRMIIALENVELANNAVNNDRRKSLLAWNRGTRIFAAEFSRAGGQQTAARLQKIQFALEQCRMVLFTPVTTSIHDGPDWVEVNMVQRARDFFFHNDTANCRAIIDGLHADNGVSRFAGFAALLLLAALRRNEVEGCEERREQILSLATMLEEQRLGAGPGWGPLLRSWEEFAEQLLHSVPQGA